MLVARQRNHVEIGFTLSSLVSRFWVRFVGVDSALRPGPENTSESSVNVCKGQELNSLKAGPCVVCFAASLTPVSTSFLLQESAPSNYLLQAVCVSLGVMLNFNATHDFCCKTVLHMQPNFSHPHNIEKDPHATEDLQGASQLQGLQGWQ